MDQKHDLLRHIGEVTGHGYTNTVKMFTNDLQQLAIVFFHFFNGLYNFFYLFEVDMLTGNSSFLHSYKMPLFVNKYMCNVQYYTVHLTCNLASCAVLMTSFWYGSMTLELILSTAPLSDSILVCIIFRTPVRACVR